MKQPIHLLKNTCAPYIVEDEAEFVLAEKYSKINVSIPAFTATYKNMKKFTNEIFKRNR